MKQFLPALSLLGSLVLLPACAHEGALAPAPDGAQEALEVERIELLHASAAELAPLLDVADDDAADRARVAADPRTNSLLLCGSASARAGVRAQIARLDVPAR